MACPVGEAIVCSYQKQTSSVADCSAGEHIVSKK